MKTHRIVGGILHEFKHFQLVLELLVVADLVLVVPLAANYGTEHKITILPLFITLHWIWQILTK